METTNPDKIMFPDRGLTKADLVGYYRTVAERMAPMLLGRPLTLHRFPNGVGAKGFMQKNAGKHFPDSILRHEVPKQEGGVTTYPIITGPDDIPWLANQGSIAFHIWLSTVDEPVPVASAASTTWLVLDLDPPAAGRGGSAEARGADSPVMAVARTSAEVLEDFGLSSVPVVTGSKGVHLWVPVSPSLPETAAHRLAAVNRALAGLVAKRVPELATTEFLKRERKGRVFVDWLRANRGATVVAPLSVRATATGSVAVPVDWDELDTVVPGQWTLTDAEELAVRPTLLERVADLAEPGALDEATAARVEVEARRVGVDLDTPFDRFGRKRSSG